MTTRICGDCGEELNKVLIQLKIIRDESMLQYNQKHISDFNQVRSQAFEEAAAYVEKQNLLHNEFCNYYSKEGASCDCHMAELADGLRKLGQL